MKILLLGGYGVFGARLAQLLLRDGHRVTIAGRNLSAANAMATELGCAARQMDRRGDLGPLADHEVVIDAAGPFHTYGADPYRLPRAAIAAGLHYLDLSDDAAFCAGIAALDPDARAAGLCVLSGLSSVPAISSAAVRALAGDAVPRVIDSAILPGNRSPRGISVMTSILAQAGRPLTVWRGGEWAQSTGWSDPMDYTLPDGLRRQGWQIEVPDLRLFPAHFGAETVRFRAGLELAVMRYGLAAFAALCRIIPVPVTAALVQGFKRAADLLAPFGSGRGGMSVMVIADDERRWWRLLAEEGDGPYIPAIAARALLRRALLPVGAAPALEAVTLAEIEAAMSDLRVRTERSTEPLDPIFAHVLGPTFAQLPELVRATHQTADRSRWHGHASVRRGKGLWARCLGRLFGFPPSAREVPVEVIKTVTQSGETWQRRFGNRSFRSRLAMQPAGMTESFGPFTFLLGLEVRDNALHYPVRSGRLGPLPLPRWCLPVSQAREYVEAGVFRFDVTLLAPVTRELIVQYRGYLRAAPRENPGVPAQRISGSA
jgi:NAD(P)-dependent dehydrogenase (short-subunit alcohol dehydrogenase family)